MIVVRLTAAAGRCGRGEAAGVDYDGETPQTMAEQLQSVQSQLHAGLTGEELLSLLPAGGGRNALDCAFWDLRARQSGVPVWQATGLPRPRPVTTAFTIGLSDVADVCRKAEAARGLPLLKLKVDAERHVDLVRVVPLAATARTRSATKRAACTRRRRSSGVDARAGLLCYYARAF